MILHMYSETIVYPLHCIKYSEIEGEKCFAHLARDICGLQAEERLPSHLYIGY